MRTRAGLFLAVAIAVCPSYAAGAAPGEAPASTMIRGGCDVAFLGTSTLHDFSGKAACRSFTAALVRDASGRAVLPSVEVEVPVAGMRTGNDSRDGKMREMFQGDRFSLIRASVQDVDVDRIRGETGNNPEGKAPLDLLLRIRNVERRIRASAGSLKESGDRVTFDIEFPVSIREFDLKAPSVLGIIRVGDKVSVKATFALTVSRSP